MAMPPLATMKRRVEQSMSSLHHDADELVATLEDLPRRNATQDDVLRWARAVRALMETTID
jgi:hypothetical protein